MTVDQPGPPTVRLIADPPVANNATEILLTWSASNATTCTASGGWSGIKTPIGYQVLPPVQISTEFALDCSGPSGVASATASVEIVQAPSVALTADPPSIYIGEVTELSWTATNASSCVASEGWTGPHDLTGTETVGPLSVTTTFRLSCTGQVDEASASTTVEVTAPPPPFLSLVALDEVVPRGAIAMLQWDSSQMSNCEASGGWSGPVSRAGVEPVGPLEAPQTFTITCQGPDGVYTADAAVDVEDIPSTHGTQPVEIFSADFVTLTGRIGHEGYFSLHDEPVLRNSPATLLVQLLGEPSVVTWSLVDDLDNEIAPIVLDPCTAAGESRYIGSVDLPPQRFRVRATGSDGPFRCGFGR